MIGNNDYDYYDNEYLNDNTVEISLSCEDYEYREDSLKEKILKKGLFYRIWLSIKTKAHCSEIYMRCPA